MFRSCRHNAEEYCNVKRETRFTRICRRDRAGMMVLYGVVHVCVSLCDVKSLRTLYRSSGESMNWANQTSDIMTECYATSCRRHRFPHS